MTIHNVIADSDQLSMLTKVLDAYCLANGILDDADRDDAAYRLMQIFRQGAETEDALFSRLQRGARPQLIAV